MTDMTAWTCQALFERASAYRDGDLSDDASGAYERHLEACPECAKFYQGFNKSIEAAERVVMSPPPADLEALVLTGFRERLAKIA